MVASSLFMTSLQKTFAIAASRDMIPEATLMVYCVLDNGEVLVDTLAFHVDGIRSNGVS